MKQVFRNIGMAQRRMFGGDWDPQIERYETSTERMKDHGAKKLISKYHRLGVI